MCDSVKDRLVELFHEKLNLWNVKTWLVCKMLLVLQKKYVAAFISMCQIDSH